MHELPVTQGILDVATAAAQENGGGRIVAIDLVIGELASIVDDSVQFYFDILSKGTLAEGAQLRFQRRPAQARCEQCEHAFAARPPLPAQCPRCGGVRLTVEGGREFFVESLEIDDQDSGRSTDTERQ